MFIYKGKELTFQDREVFPADYVYGWNMSLLGPPKLTITCGNCHGTFRTRNYITIKFKGVDIGSGTSCAYCGSMNFFELVYGD